MRWLIRLVLVVLAACTSSHSIRVRTIDGLTGRPLRDERLNVQTHLTSSSCSHEEHSKPFGLGHSEGNSANTDIDNTRAKTGKDGWATIEIIESRGVCDYKPTSIEIWVRGGGSTVPIGTKGPVFVPVFFTWPKMNSSERSYATMRAKDAFTPIDAVKSVYEERFVRVSNHNPTAFQNGNTILIGSSPEIHADGDGNDPFIRVALANVRADGTAWRIELTALELFPTTPTYIVPRGFEKHRAQLDAWAKANLDEVVFRAATAAKIIDRHYLETNEWAIETRVEGPTVIAKIANDTNPYDSEPAKKHFVVRGNLTRRDGKVVVENIEQLAD